MLLVQRLGLLPAGEGYEALHQGAGLCDVVTLQSGHLGHKVGGDVVVRVLE